MPNNNNNNNNNNKAHCFAQWAKYKEAARVPPPSHRKWMQGSLQTRREAKASRQYLVALSAAKWWAAAARGWHASEEGRAEYQCDHTGARVPGVVRLADYFRELPALEAERPEWAHYLRR